MVEALAKRRWPDCRVQSAGTDVANAGDGAASEAIFIMEKFGLDIKAHKQTPLSDVDLGEFEFVVALTKSIRRALLEKYGVEESKIRNVYVDDPYGSDIEQYMKCAIAISKRLAEVEFTKNSN